MSSTFGIYELDGEILFTKLENYEKGDRDYLLYIFYLNLWSQGFQIEERKYQNWMSINHNICSNTTYINISHKGRGMLEIKNTKTISLIEMIRDAVINFSKTGVQPDNAEEILLILDEFCEYKKRMENEIELLYEELSRKDLFTKPTKH